MKDIAALYFSPRVRGNSDLLLDEFLRGASEAGVGAKRIYSRKLNVQACAECGGCDETGECVLRDDMDDIYPILIEAEKIVVVAPIFFYGLPSDGKAIVDRSQALWNRIKLKPELKRPQGRGFFLGVGATKGKNLFEGTILCIKYFMDALGLPLQIDTLTFPMVEAKGAINDHPTAMADTFAAGKKFAQD
jgi:multimeric flavodoxin WrbA